MAFDAGSVIGHIILDSSDFVKGSQDVNKHSASMTKSIQKVGKEMASLGGKMTARVTLPVLALGAAFLKSASDMENYQTSFTTLLSSADKAKAMLSDLNQFAAATPFSITDLAASAKMLLGFGQTAESIMPTMKMLGDVAQGNKEKFSSLTLVYSQVMSQGKLMGQDLLQLINAGFNPLTIMAKQTGKSIAVLKEEMSQGAISADMVTAAFQSATSEGGLFFGGMEAASKTLSGQFSTLMDDGMALGRSFLEMILPAIKDLMAGASGLIKSLMGLDDGTKSVILTIAGVAAVMGPAIGAIGGLITVFTTANPVILGICITLGAVAIAAVAISNALKDNSKEWKTQDEWIKQNTVSFIEYKKALVFENQFTKKSLPELQKTLSDTDKYIEETQNKLYALMNPPKTAQPFTPTFVSGDNAQEKANAIAMEKAKKNAADRIKLESDLSAAIGTRGEIVSAVNAKEAGAIKAFEELDLTGFKEEFQTTMDLISDDTEETTMTLGEKWEAASGLIFDALQNLYQNISGALAQSLENDQTLEDNDYKRKKAQIEATVTDEAEKKKQLEALEKDHAAKTAEIKKKQFESQKVASIISAIIATAVGVANALSMAQLFPFNFVLAGIIAAAGAVQIGTIASQPTPEFAGGTGMGTYQGLALVGERGPELVNFGQPAQIFPADQTSGMLGGGIRQENNFYGDINSEIDLDRASAQQARKLRTLLRAS
jgi:tape measure domain-containing protein